MKNKNKQFFVLFMLILVCLFVSYGCSNRESDDFVEVPKKTETTFNEKKEIKDITDSEDKLEETICKTSEEVVYNETLSEELTNEKEIENVVVQNEETVVPTAPTNKKEEEKIESTITISKEEEHSHQWKEVYETVDRGYWEKELVKEALKEEIPIYENKKLYICHGCGKDISDIILSGDINLRKEHEYNHLIKGENAGWYDDYQIVQVGVNVINHEAEYKDVWVPEFVEEVVGYSCDCGAYKDL